ncbi:hypothetical protein QL285_037946 [Trifolium repens]|jgi:hypothetical protein|nr:hypothetical protein QL285_037946 [Trifolium repens]
MLEPKDQKLKPSNSDVLDSKVLESEHLKTSLKDASTSEAYELSLSKSESCLSSTGHVQNNKKIFLDKGNERILPYSTMDLKCLSNDGIHLRQHSNVFIGVS